VECPVSAQARHDAFGKKSVWLRNAERLFRCIIANLLLHALHQTRIGQSTSKLLKNGYLARKMEGG